MQGVLKVLLCLALFFISSSNMVFAQAEGKSKVVSFCEILNNPKLYYGVNVTFRATFRFAFDNEEVYCLGCRDKATVSVLVANEYLTKNAKKKLKKVYSKKNSGTFNALFTGEFTNRRATHYSHGFTLKDIDQVEFLSDSGHPPRKLDSKVLRRVCMNKTLNPKLNKCSERPKAIYYAFPDYPKFAEEQELEGTVTVSIEINQAGGVSSVKFEKGLKEFMGVIKDVLGSWEFEVSEEESRTVTYHFEFRLMPSHYQNKVGASFQPPNKIRVFGVKKSI